MSEEIKNAVATAETEAAKTPVSQPKRIPKPSS